LPLGEPEIQPSDFELTTSQKNVLRAIEVGCENAISLAPFEAEIIVENRCNQTYQQKLDGFQNAWVTERAIKNKDVSICEESKNQLKCVKSYSVEFEDPNACNTLADNTSCLLSYAKKFKDPSICQKLSDSQSCLESLIPSLGVMVCTFFKSDKIEECQKNYFIENWPLNRSGHTNDSPGNKGCSSEFLRYPGKVACRLQGLGIESIPIKNLLTWKVNGELLVCYELIKNEGQYSVPRNLKSKENRHNFCLAVIGAYANDLSICDRARTDQHTSWRVECYFSEALIEDYFTLKTCDKLRPTGIDECYGFVAARTNDPSICDLPQIVGFFGRNTPETSQKACNDVIRVHQASLK